MIELKNEFMTSVDPNRGRSDSGRYAVLTKGRKSLLFDAEKREIVATLLYQIRAFCFDAEEKALFSLEFNGTLHIYDLIEKKEVFEKKIGERGFAYEHGIAVRGNEIYCVGVGDKNTHFVRSCYHLDTDTTERELMPRTGGMVGTYKDMVICRHTLEECDRFTLLRPDGSETAWREYNWSSSCYHSGALYSKPDFRDDYSLNIDYLDGREKRQILLPRKAKGFRFGRISTFDTDGRYFAFVSRDCFPAGNEYVICYDMQTKTVVYRDELEYLYSVAVLKNGFLYGGFTKSRFVGFEELENNASRH